MTAMTGRSRRIVGTVIASGAIAADRPSTSNRLTMLVPATLPMASGPASLMAESIPMASSGALVPTEITVRPTTTGGTPSAAASADAPRTSTSAPTISIARPAATSRTAFIGASGGAPMDHPVIHGRRQSGRAGPRD